METPGDLNDLDMKELVGQLDVRLPPSPSVGIHNACAGVEQGARRKSPRMSASRTPLGLERGPSEAPWQLRCLKFPALTLVSPLPLDRTTPTKKQLSSGESAAVLGRPRIFSMLVFSAGKGRSVTMMESGKMLAVGPSSAKRHSITASDGGGSESLRESARSSSRCRRPSAKMSSFKKASRGHRCLACIGPQACTWRESERIATCAPSLAWDNLSLPVCFGRTS